MTNINVQINKTQVVMPDAPEIVSGGVKNLQLNFTFSSDWANYTTKQAIFYRDRNAPLMPIEITNNLCIVPADVIYDWGYFYFGVIGKVDDIVHTTEIVKVKVEKGAFSVETAPTPTPNIYQQMLQVFNSKVDTSVYNTKINELETEINNKVIMYDVGSDITYNGVSQTFFDVYTICNSSDKLVAIKVASLNNAILNLQKSESNRIVFSGVIDDRCYNVILCDQTPAPIGIMYNAPLEYITNNKIDQTYNETSTNAQSGVAMAGVISNLSDKLSELSDIAIKYKNSNNVVTSWEDVQRIVRAGLAQDVFEIGEQLVCNHATYGTMVWNIIGIDQENIDGTDYNHSLTLQLDRIISNNIAFKAFDSTGVTNSWEISQIRDWLNGAFFDGLDSDFKSVIAQTTKITGDTQTQDKMFLLSKQEVGISGYKFYQEDNRNRLFARGSYWILRTSAGVERTNGWLLVDLVLNHNYTTQTIGNTAVQSPRGIVPACCIM